MSRSPSVSSPSAAAQALVEETCRDRALFTDDEHALCVLSTLEDLASPFDDVPLARPTDP